MSLSHLRLWLITSDDCVDLPNWKNNSEAKIKKKSEAFLIYFKQAKYSDIKIYGKFSLISLKQR